MEIHLKLDLQSFEVLKTLFHLIIIFNLYKGEKLEVGVYFYSS